jgi:hypothetical protein
MVLTFQVAEETTKVGRGEARHGRGRWRCWVLHWGQEGRRHGRDVAQFGVGGRGRQVGVDLAQKRDQCGGAPELPGSSAAAPCIRVDSLDKETRVTFFP